MQIEESLIRRKASALNAQVKLPLTTGDLKPRRGRRQERKREREELLAS